MHHRRILIAGAVAAAVIVGARFIQPSNERDWAVDQAILPYAEIAPPLVTIHGIRNFRYTSAEQYQPAYYDKVFDLRKLDSVWFVVEPFGQPGAAHTFVSFGFGDDEYLAISIEIRKEKGESFSAIGGLLRRYELMYVVGDERDLIQLRTNHRRDPVHLYRVATTQQKREAMFLSMLARANALRTKPEFYNTLTNTCTTNLVRHVNEIAPDRVPRSLAVLLPSNSDRLAYDIGLLDRTFTFDETRARARINDKAERAAGADDFSRKIRE
ncbi:MAG TPA: DUF4105 domain-containing protein [Thermoanaerobaculia bacterium]|nr:DUF4105 domain-containing protein [Thermoanaerobaculia bacterium]